MSVGTVEYALDARPGRPFPRDWTRWGGSAPPPFTPERDGWMRAGYHEGELRALAGEDVPWLPADHWAVRVARLRRRQEAPAVVALARRRLLELRARELV